MLEHLNTASPGSLSAGIPHVLVKGSNEQQHCESYLSLRDARVEFGLYLNFLIFVVPNKF